MCELLGISSEKEELVNEYLKTFYSHSDKHPHGWGLAYLYDGQIMLNFIGFKIVVSKKMIIFVGKSFILFLPLSVCLVHK